MPRRNDNSTAIILGLIGAGIACGLMLVGGWLMFRHPNESERAKQQREFREQIESNQASGKPTLGESMLDMNIGKDRRVAP